jgi:hypothetical protein
MTKITIEIDDVLPERVEYAIEQVKDLLRDYVRREEPDELPCLHNDLDYSGDVHGIIDGEVPIYTRDIEAAWFLHGRDLEEAYESAGIGENPREYDGRTAIYCYIEQKVCEWFHDHGQEVFEEAKEGAK